MHANFWNLRRQPEEYHSAAMQHLESFLGSMSEPNQAGFGGGLEELQAVLLLAGFALLRPVGKSDFAVALPTFCGEHRSYSVDRAT